MRTVILVFAALIIAVFAKPAEDKYSSKYDNINIDEILNSDRLLNNYVNCLTEKGSCTPDGKELKRVLPDALETECSKCTEHQRKNTKKIVTFIVNNKPDLWEKLSKKYDPTGVYKVKYQNIAEKEGIKI